MYPRKDDTAHEKYLQSNSEKASPSLLQRAIQHRKGEVAGASIHMKVFGLIHRSQHNWGSLYCSIRLGISFAPLKHRIVLRPRIILTQGRQAG